jgi:hypothetical protein
MTQHHILDDLPDVYSSCEMEHHSTVIWPWEHIFVLSSLEIECNMGECLNHHGSFIGFVKDHTYLSVPESLAESRCDLQQWTADTGKVHSKVKSDYYSN